MDRRHGWAFPYNTFAVGHAEIVLAGEESANQGDPSIYGGFNFFSLFSFLLALYLSPTFPVYSFLRSINNNKKTIRASHAGGGVFWLQRNEAYSVPPSRLKACRNLLLIASAKNTYFRFLLHVMGWPNDAALR
jgi:hypothetical protein